MESIEQPQDITRTTSEALVQSFIRPEGKIFLLYGERIIFKLSMLMTSHILSRDFFVTVVDGCNGFDLHTITRFARERRLDPALFLDHTYISRGFTCYQMEAAITDQLPAFLNSIHSRTGIVLGLLDTFYDEQVSSREVQQILTRVLLTFEEVKRRGISILLVCYEWNIISNERNSLFIRLKESVDRVYHLIPDKTQKPQLYLEQPIHMKGR